MGSYRGAAALCGTTHKTVKRVLERLEAGQVEPRVSPPSNTASVVDLVTQNVQATDGRISANRLLPVARAAGLSGPAASSRSDAANALARCGQSAPRWLLDFASSIKARESPYRIDKRTRWPSWRS